jgi:hypothetical protein
MIYEIWGRRYGEPRQRELARCGSNPQAVVEGFKQKRVSLTGRRKKKITAPQYDQLEIRETGDGQ